MGPLITTVAISSQVSQRSGVAGSCSDGSQESSGSTPIDHRAPRTRRGVIPANPQAQPGVTAFVEIGSDWRKCQKAMADGEGDDSQRIGASTATEVGIAG